MKKLSLLVVFGALVVVLSNCGPSKKATAEETPPAPAKLTFATNVMAVIQDKCAPCHVPAKGGNKKPYTIYANVKTDIDDILRRIQLNPGERGFMPMGRPQVKLSDSLINVFKQWKADGLLEN